MMPIPHSRHPLPKQPPVCHAGSQSLMQLRPHLQAIFQAGVLSLAAHDEASHPRSITPSPTNPPQDPGGRPPPGVAPGCGELLLSCLREPAGSGGCVPAKIFALEPFLEPCLRGVGQTGSGKGI